MVSTFDVQNVLNKAFVSVGVEWYIKGILDSKKRLYTISDDTKLISKIFELVSIPIITKAVEPYIKSWEIEERQTVYPDLTLILSGSSPNKIAIDIKSTYRKGSAAGFTLGSYTAYLRPPFTKKLAILTMSILNIGSWASFTIEYRMLNLKWWILVHWIRLSHQSETWKL
jgi:hypothetical protein